MPYKKTAAAALSTCLFAAGCSPEGVGGIRLLDCEAGPKANTLDIGVFPKGEELDLEHPSAEIRSLGKGLFNVTIKEDDGEIRTREGTTSSFEGQNGNVSVTPKILANGETDTVTYTKDTHRYTLIGKIGINDATSLSVKAECIKD